MGMSPVLWTFTAETPGDRVELALEFTNAATGSMVKVFDLGTTPMTFLAPYIDASLPTSTRTFTSTSDTLLVMLQDTGYSIGPVNVSFSYQSVPSTQAASPATTLSESDIATYKSSINPTNARAIPSHFNWSTLSILPGGQASFYVPANYAEDSFYIWHAKVAATPCGNTTMNLTVLEFDTRTAAGTGGTGGDYFVIYELKPSARPGRDANTRLAYIIGQGTVSVNNTVYNTSAGSELLVFFFSYGGPVSNAGVTSTVSSSLIGASCAAATPSPSPSASPSPTPSPSPSPTPSASGSGPTPSPPSSVINQLQPTASPSPLPGSGNANGTGTSPAPAGLVGQGFSKNYTGLPRLAIVQLRFAGVSFNLSSASGSGSPLLLGDGAVRIDIGIVVVQAPIPGGSGVVTVRGEGLPTGEPIEIFIVDFATQQWVKAPFAEIASSTEIRFQSPAMPSSSRRKSLRSVLGSTVVFVAGRSYDIRVTSIAAVPTFAPFVMGNVFQWIPTAAAASSSKPLCYYHQTCPQLNAASSTHASLWGTVASMTAALLLNLVMNVIRL
eukprot:tig00000057_g107.t1